jgi:hypothetical protein
MSTWTIFLVPSAAIFASRSGIAEPTRAIVLREVVPLDDPRESRVAEINQIARFQVCKIEWPVFGESPQKSGSFGTRQAFIDRE